MSYIGGLWRKMKAVSRAPQPLGSGCALRAIHRSSIYVTNTPTVFPRPRPAVIRRYLESCGYVGDAVVEVLHTRLSTDPQVQRVPCLAMARSVSVARGPAAKGDAI